MIADHKFYRAISLATVIAFCLLCLFLPLLNQVDNWDMLGYAASVKSLYGMDPVSLHSAVFAEYKTYATAHSFEQLTTDSSYRRTMHMDAEAFYQQIPFYKIRILYILLLTAAVELGVNVFTAMHFFSAFFAAAAFLIIYLSSRRYVHPLVWIVATAFYFLYTLELTIFEYGGVDSLAFFWVAMTVVAFTRGSKWLYPLLALSVLVRTDLVLHVVLMFAASMYWNRTDWRHIGIWGLITLIAYFGVNSWSGNLGWTALINFVFVSEMLATNPIQYAQNKLEIKQYLGFIFSKYDWISNWFWLGIAISVINLKFFLAHLFSPQNRTTDDHIQYANRLQIVSTICLIYIVLHYLLFPAVFMRFFYGQCFLSTLALLTTISVAARRNENKLLVNCTKQSVHR